MCLVRMHVTWSVFHFIFLQRGYDVRLLSGVFSQAVTFNSLIAILSGVVAQLSVDRFGYT